MTRGGHHARLVGLCLVLLIEILDVVRQKDSIGDDGDRKVYKPDYRPDNKSHAQTHEVVQDGPLCDQPPVQGSPDERTTADFTKGGMPGNEHDDHTDVKT